MASLSSDIDAALMRYAESDFLTLSSARRPVLSAIARALKNLKSYDELQVFIKDLEKSAE